MNHSGGHDIAHVRDNKKMNLTVSARAQYRGLLSFWIVRVGSRRKSLYLGLIDPRVSASEDTVTGGQSILGLKPTTTVAVESFPTGGGGESLPPLIILIGVNDLESLTPGS